MAASQGASLAGGRPHHVYSGADAQTIEADVLQAELAHLIAADLPRRQQAVDGMRQVGFGELPAYGCGGTHVATLAEMGR